MKKILLTVILFTGISVFAQEEKDTKKKDFIIGVKLQAGQITTLGIEAEFNGEFSKNNNYKSRVAFISSSAVSYNDGIYSHIGSGFELGLGNRNYLQKGKESRGFYSENFLTYGKIDFDHTYSTYTFPATTTSIFDGTYSYWSIFNTNIGYKLKAGSFVFEPSLGGQWNWEVKGKGQVDNKNIENLFFRGSFKIAYTF